MDRNLYKAHQLWENGELEEALVLLESLEEKDSDTLLDIALIYFELGKLDTAEQIIGKIIMVDTKHAGAHYSLATIYDEVGDYDNAIEFFAEIGNTTKVNVFDSFKEWMVNHESN